MRGTTYARLGKLMASRNRALEFDPENAPTPPPLDDRDPKEWTRSNVIEDLIAKACEEAGVEEVLTVPTYHPTPHTPAASPFADDPISGHWTF